MLDGKTFLPVTGTPIRKIACMMRPLAEADPVPLAVAILNAKSLTRSIPQFLAKRFTYGPRRHRDTEKEEFDKTPRNHFVVFVPSSCLFSVSPCLRGLYVDSD